MTYPVSVDKIILQQWAAQQLELPEVETHLKGEGLDDDTIKLYVKAYQQLRNEKRQFAGFICMGLGAFMGFVSCVLSLINPFPDLYNLILFGLTSLAILVIVAGMYLVFE